MIDREEMRYLIRNNLDRLRRLRKMNAPLLVIRSDQLLLWAKRQRLLYGDKDDLPTRQLPGWKANYERFVLIHMADDKHPH